MLLACRYGYSNIQQLERVVQSYAYFKIPLETFVTDSQYMDHDQGFTISPDFEPFGVSAPLLGRWHSQMCVNLLHRHSSLWLKASSEENCAAAPAK